MSKATDGRRRALTALLLGGLIAIGADHAGVVTSADAGTPPADRRPAAVMTPSPVPANSVPPGISGTAKVGVAITALEGGWSGSLPIRFAWQWQRCTPAACINIAGATSAAYVPQRADAGMSLRALITATNADGATAMPTAPTATVAG